MKHLSALLAIAGICIALALIAWFGFDNIAGAMAKIAATDFAVIVGWQFALFAVLGVAWFAVLPHGAARHPGQTAWARMVRDSSGNCLPFSQLGGFVFGTRAAMLTGMGWANATASTVVDVTAEFLAQLVFSAIGLSLLLAEAPDSAFAMPAGIGLGLAFLGCCGFVWAQQGASSLFARFGKLVAGARLHDAAGHAHELQTALNAIYANPKRLAFGFAAHMVAWLMAGVAGWIAYRALGVSIPFASVVAIEALLSALAAAAFLVPVAAGVQEAGYAGLGAIFGVPAELSLGVSLLRRARDVLVGVPILLLWQALEVRRLRSSRQ